MKLALWQAPPSGGDCDAAMAGLERALRAAAAMGAEMLVAPELLLPGYNVGGIAGLAQGRDGPWLRALSAMARAAGCGVVLGWAERAGPVIHNAAAAVGADGEVLAHYRKIQLYGPREKALFTPGAGYVDFRVSGRKAALLICYDVEFAPHVAALAGQGVEVILVPTANMLPFTHVSRATVPAMAANHGVSIVYANFCGVEGDLAYCGGSLIVAADGEVLAQAGMAEALLVCELPPVDPARLATQLADYRPVG